MMERIPSVPRLTFLQPKNPASLTERALRRLSIPFELRSPQSVLEDSSTALLIIDLDSSSDGELRLLANAQPGRNSCCPMLFMTAGVDSTRLSRLRGVPVETNLLAGNLAGMAENAEDLRIAVQKILRKDVFGIEQYFSSGVELHRFELTQSNGRFALLDAAERVATRGGVSARFASMFRTVVDELIMNALYNAPVDTHGVPRFAKRSRDEEICLSSEERAEITFATDGFRLGVSVSDPFGTLTKQVILERLRTHFDGGLRDVRKGEGGAGLGLPLVLDMVSHLIVNSWPGRRTEMIGILPCGGSFREFAALEKSFHFFSQGTPLG